jgi:hypothetical protein
MDELDLIGKAVSIKFSNCTVLCTGDLLVGKKDATRHKVLDAMIANWMNDPVHGTKAGYSKMAVKLAERGSPKPRSPPRRRVPPRRRQAAPDPAPAATSRGMSAAGAARIQVTTLFPGPTRTGEGVGSPDSPAAAVAAVADAAAPAAEAEAVRPTTTTCATCLILAEPAKISAPSTVFVQFLSSFFFLIVLCRKKKILKKS